ncbi:uncharacterized protein PGTG_08348 [Puccinia graminis f. sp. tritici CRL 75-36-700-3]|uniref:C2H2-type domain-containing protein n=1 Tax=Puccinia graminis f. sp. tritici (strain CRL 75-36-700-3 / race SCCL) TaxID=418459 RepID=E3KDF6_PUCGT|nr:uncharacterized protein PGTG_08348 [Puccinia graminis f. sp. tritici CRL 75-36-700-3]EFP82392.1 hypothetical protein PGTG_08348 [Puccinia graminis f. sp. tritici CRL 75-36-700-3]
MKLETLTLVSVLIGLFCAVLQCGQVQAISECPIPNCGRCGQAMSLMTHNQQCRKAFLCKTHGRPTGRQCTVMREGSYWRCHACDEMLDGLFHRRCLRTHLTPHGGICVSVTDHRALQLARQESLCYGPVVRTN